MKQLAFDFHREKKCSKCGQVKSLDKFWKRPTKHGRRTDCIECCRARSKRYYLKHGSEIRARVRKYQVEHHEKIKDYRLMNREKRMAQKRRWDAENGDHILAYREQNRETAIVKTRKWQHANPEKVHAIKSRYRTRKAGAGGSFTAEEWQVLCEKYGNKCLCCGTTDKPLAHDHIIPVSKGGSSNIENLQPLCGSCNSKKGTKTIDYRPF